MHFLDLFLPTQHIYQTLIRHAHILTHCCVFLLVLKVCTDIVALTPRPSVILDVATKDHDEIIALG